MGLISFFACHGLSLSFPHPSLLSTFSPTSPRLLPLPFSFLPPVLSPLIISLPLIPPPTPPPPPTCNLTLIFRPCACVRPNTGCLLCVRGRGVAVRLPSLRPRRSGPSPHPAHHSCPAPPHAHTPVPSCQQAGGSVLPRTWLLLRAAAARFLLTWRSPAQHSP